MVVPGKNLEFEELPEFRRRCSPVGGLREEVIAQLQNRPRSALPVAGPVWTIDIVHLERAYAVYFGRRRNSIGLTAIFALPAETAQRLDYEHELQKRYR
jgi:hypothetical protein